MRSRRAPPDGRRGLVAIAVAAVLLMAGALTVAFLLPDSTLPDNDGKPTGSNGNPAGFLCDASESSLLVPFLDGVARVSETQVALLDLEGKERWSVKNEMTNPYGTTAGGRLLVIDPGGFSCAVFDRGGLVWSLQTKGHVDGATISPSGHVALLTDESGYKGVVTALAPDGATLFQWSSAETGYVLSAAVDPLGKRLDVAALQTDGSALYPVLRTFTLAGEARMQTKLEAGPALPLILQDEADRTVLCGGGTLVGFQDGQSAGDVAYRIDLPGLRTVLWSSGGPVYVRTDGDTGSTLLGRIRDGRTGPVTAIPSVLSAIAVRSDLCATGSGASLLVVDVSRGTRLLQEAMEDEILAIGFTDDKSLVVVTRTSVRLVSIG